MVNRFASAEDVGELLGQLAGFASLCWEPKPEGIFDSQLASAGVDDALERLKEIEAQEVTCLSCELKFPKIKTCQVVVAGEVKKPICPECFDTVKTLARFNHA